MWEALIPLLHGVLGFYILSDRARETMSFPLPMMSSLFSLERSNKGEAPTEQRAQSPKYRCLQGLQVSPVEEEEGRSDWPGLSSGMA